MGTKYATLWMGDVRLPEGHSNIGHATLSNIRDVLSGTFKCARRRGFLNTPDAGREIREGRPARETYAQQAGGGDQDARGSSRAGPDGRRRVLLPVSATRRIARLTSREPQGRRDADHQFRMAEPRAGAEAEGKRGHVFQSFSTFVPFSIATVRRAAVLDRHRTVYGNPAEGFIFTNAVGSR
jgi:hypothetical protein